MTLIVTQQSQVSIATSIIQAVVVILPFLLAASRYMFDTEYWENVDPGGLPDILIPGFLIISYLLLLFSADKTVSFLTSSVIQSPELDTAVEFIGLFVFAMSIILVMPVISAVKSTYVKLFLLLAWMGSTGAYAIAPFIAG
jgi:hypothetical protein